MKSVYKEVSENPWSRAWIEFTEQVKGQASHRGFDMKRPIRNQVDEQVRQLIWSRLMDQTYSWVES